MIYFSRLRRLGQGSTRTFITNDSATGPNNLLVCTGGTDIPIRDTGSFIVFTYIKNRLYSIIQTDFVLFFARKRYQGTNKLM